MLFDYGAFSPRRSTMGIFGQNPIQDAQSIPPIGLTLPEQSPTVSPPAKPPMGIISSAVPQRGIGTLGGQKMDPLQQELLPIAGSAALGQKVGR